MCVSSLCTQNMNNLKRLNNSSKAPYNSKTKDSKMSSSRHKLLEVHSPGTECPSPVFPIVKQIDNNRLLPRYTTVLTRTPEDGVGMEDLDQLQQDLEKLLSTASVRHRMLSTEIESIDRVEERRKNKKGKPVDKQQPLKRKRLDERIKYKDVKLGMRFIKTKHNMPISNFNDLSIKREVPKVSFPKNDTSDKFWLSVEPFCSDVTKEDVIFLDELIQECSQDIDIKIPELGSHYSMDWSDDVLGHERGFGNGHRSNKTKPSNFNSELKKNGMHAMVDTFSSPLTQRLLASLIEEKVVIKSSSATDKLKSSDFSNFKSLNNSRNGSCMDRRLRKELVDQGILEVEDLPKSYPQEDEIFLEIQKCIAELKVVNEKNITELNKLRTIVAKDLRRQEVKEALDKVDNQIMDLYNKLLLSKQKQTLQNEDETFEKQLNFKPNLDEYDEETNELIQQQTLLQKELYELINAVAIF